MKQKSRHLQMPAAKNAVRVAPIGRGEPVEGALRSRFPIARLRGTEGVVFVEYVALLLLVTIIGAGAVVALGIPLVNLSRYQELVLSLPVP